MRNPDYPDCFVVANGPEDGTEFPIVRAPFYIGRDPSCAVNIRQDEAVRDFHVLVSAVSDGYRIRRNDDAPVYVNGKRAGMLRSRIVRSDGQIRVGNTLLCLICADDGLASRSHGIDTQGDLGWIIAQGARGLLRLGTGLVRFVTRVFGRLLGSWVGVGAVFVLLYAMWPGFRYQVQRLFYLIYYHLSALLSQLL
jgi:hypothetical protein